MSNSIPPSSSSSNFPTTSPSSPNNNHNLNSTTTTNIKITTITNITNTINNINNNNNINSLSNSNHPLSQQQQHPQHNHHHHHHAQHHSFLPPHPYMIQQQEQSDLDEQDDKELSNIQSTTKRERLRAIDFVSGSIASIVSDTLLQPLDTVKTRQQFVGDSTNRFVYKNTLDAFITIAKTEGRRGLFRGWVPTMFGSLPAGAIYFGTYESMKRLLLENSEFLREHKNFAYMLAGSSAEFMGSLVFVPSELIKCRFQTNSLSSHQYSQSTLKTFYQVSRSEGIRGLFRGYSATMVRDIPYSMTQFLIYEVLKKSILNRKMDQYRDDLKNSKLVDPQESLKSAQKLTFAESIVVGGTAGAMAASLSNPIDVIKTRLQTSTTFNGGFVDMFRKIKQDDGWRGFFKGITPRVMWVTLSTGIMFSVFELVSQNLTDFWFESQQKAAAEKEE